MSQNWEVRLNKNVRKTLKDLGKGVNRRLKTALKKLEENPKLGKGLSGYKGFYSYRTGTPGGEYRIIYRLKREENLFFHPNYRKIDIRAFPCFSSCMGTEQINLLGTVMTEDGNDLADLFPRYRSQVSLLVLYMFYGHIYPVNDNVAGPNLQTPRSVF